MSHRATCSWDGSHQSGPGKVELAFLRPLFDAYAVKFGRPALQAALAAVHFYVGEAHHFDIWLEADEIEALMTALESGAGGAEPLRQLWRWRLDVSSFALGALQDSTVPHQALLNKLATMLPGSRSWVQVRFPGLFDFIHSPAAPTSRLLGEYREAVISALLRRSGALACWWTETQDVNGAGDRHCRCVGRWKSYGFVAKTLGPLVLLFFTLVALEAAYSSGSSTRLGLVVFNVGLLLVMLLWRERRVQKRLITEAAQVRRQHNFQVRHLSAMQRLQTLLSGGPNDGLVVFGADGSVEFANQRAVEMQGLSADQARHGDVDPILAPLYEHAQRLDTALLALPGLPAGQFASLTVTQLPPGGGGARSLLVRLRPVDEDERNRMESVARAELLSTLIEHGQEAVLIIGMDGVLRYSTPNFERLFGLTADSLRKQGLAAFLDPTDQQSVVAMIRSLNAGGGINLRLRVRHGNGRGRWVQTAITDRRAMPEVGGFMMQMRDVTQLMEFEAAVRETEESLRRSEAFYRMVIEGSSDLVIIFDAKLQVLFTNQALGTVLGYQSSEVIGRDMFAFIVDQDRPKAEKAVERAMKEGRTHARVRALHRDGSQRLLEANAQFTQDPDGRKIFIVGARDVTREDALEQKAIQESRLEAIGRLAGGVAHDFNNLLTVIQGNAELALAEPDKAAGARMNEIVEASTRAGELVQQLLSFGRKQVVAPHIIDVGHLIREHEGFVQRVLGSSIRLKVRLPETPLWVKAETLGLSRALLNLAANARDAMPDGGVLELSCVPYRVEAAENQLHQERPCGDYACLEMRDSGVGMSAEVMAKIFEPYYTTRGQGTGLGLAMVFGTVKQMDGYITVQSRVGEGSTFDLYLPISENASMLPAAEPGSRRTFEPSSGQCVMVVDDEKGVRRLAADGLRMAGFKVLEASDGEEALNLWREARHNHQRIDLILSDVVMPRMTGFQLVAQVLDLDRTQRVLLMSGFYDPNQMPVQARKIDLLKPFTVQKLVDTVVAAFQS